MSKLANIRAYQASPQYAGDLIGFIKKAAGKVKGLIKKGKKIATQIPGLVEGGVKTASEIIEQVTENGGGGGGTRRRRGRGITARELRGYRKVARLLHQEGMVSRRARGRK